MAFNAASESNSEIYRRKYDHKRNCYSDNFSIYNLDKKVKIEEYNLIQQSKVVHIRNIPKEIDKVFIAFLAVPFGFIEKIGFWNISQALIQMQEIEDAVKMVNYFREYVPKFYNRHLFIQFSKYEELNYPSWQNILQTANEKRKHYINNWHNNSEGASNILDIVIDKSPQLDIDHLVFYKIFSRFGQILRIVSFTKNDQPHGFVEFADSISAHVAQSQLNGANLFGDSDIIRIDFSRSAGPLQVNTKSDTSRDYLLKPLSAKEKKELSDPDFDFPLFSFSEPLTMNHDNDNFLANIKMNESEKRTLLNCFEGASSQFLNITNQFGMEFSPAVTMAAASLLAACNMQIAQNFGIENVSRSLTYNSNDDANSCSSVVLVTNLNPEKSNPDALFNLFGLYGNVLRVNVMVTNKSNALIQFVTHEQAEAAIYNLDGIPLWGTKIHVYISNNSAIQSSNTIDSDSAAMTKDYYKSALHRFRTHGARNLTNVFPPSAVIHLTRIPRIISEDNLLQLFENKGYQITKLKMLPTKRKMVLVQLCSLEDSVHALIDFHNYRWTNETFLCVSFSKEAELL